MPLTGKSKRRRSTDKESKGKFLRTPALLKNSNEYPVARHLGNKRRTRKTGLFEYILLTLAVITTFGWLVQSDLLWTDFDQANQRPFRNELLHDAISKEHVLNKNSSSLSYFTSNRAHSPQQRRIIVSICSFI